MNGDYLQLIQSDRVRDRTSAVLIGRLKPDVSSLGQRIITNTLTFYTLQAVLDLLIPQESGNDRIDIAEIMSRGAPGGRGDGWRFADMPPDEIALETGLNLLDATSLQKFGHSFTSLSSQQQKDLLGQIQRGNVVWKALNPIHWFADLLASAVEIYVSHPSTLSRIGFSGIAFSPQWPRLGLNAAEPWEPAAR